ncbi:MAG: serine hydrolase [Sphingomicrobium sp.]
MRKIAILFSLLLFGAQPAAAESSPQLGDLERNLNSLVSRSSADVGVAVLDLRTGQSVSVRGARRYPMASTVKIAVAAAYLSQVEHGRRTLDHRIGGQSAALLMERMITKSDNPSTDLLLRDLGGPDAIQEWLDSNKISNIRIDRTIAQLLRAKRDLWDDRDSATPLAMVQLLQRLHDGKLLQPEGRDHLFGLMRRCTTGKNRMKALLPWGTPVEHKTGTLNGLTGDVGFITMPDGRRLAVAFFARGGSDRPRTIAEAARAVYDGFYRWIWSPGSAAPTAG